MGLISAGGENPLDFLELRQVLPTYDGDLRDPLWWPQERPVPMRVARWPLGIPLPSMLGPTILCSSGCQNLRIPLKCGHGSCGTSGVSPVESVLVSNGSCTCSFLPSWRSSVALPFTWIKGSVAFPRGFPTRLSHEAFPRGFPTRLSHRPVPRATVV